MVLSSDSSGTLTTVFWGPGFEEITVHELQCPVEWLETRPSKCPPSRTGSPLQFLDLALEERVRKKLNIHSYVPGDSDHHP